ncbi:alpha/beta hydrolase-fold protein [Flavihumibacter sp. CACIAM 22H1]|uniref:alpha/beta hydrolase n=1 Tax=Flavihumibacter sp. CACIAM 22H1 TaxID=1812911 RepID=UPI0007A89A79|nr:alpha/beta hydrolase-fold protein [Flavihumibacter sp. CACIAM 22H1]KYP14562.1 MAG: esterase [Flavihumibacter sp. CACIAM 22H1]
MKLICLSLFGLLFCAPVFSQSKPFVLGLIEELNSSILSEKRTVNIYLPDGYNEKDTTHYPVIYLLDGAADEDFIHISGLVQFSSFEWVNRVPKSIVVGITSADRRRDFTSATKVEEQRKNFPSSGGSQFFIDFLEKELQPFIQKKFKTTASKTLIGQSFGGLLATEILLKRPGLFNRYIIVSPSLWWNNADLLNYPVNALQAAAKNPLSIYIGVGKEGLTPGQNPRVMEVDANLLAEKIKAIRASQIRLYFDYLPAENHGSILHQAVSNAFISFAH